MTVLIAIALLMSALSASAQLCSLQSGRVTCERLKGDTSEFTDYLNRMDQDERLGVWSV